MQSAFYHRMQPAYSCMQVVDALHSGVDADNDTVIEWSRPHVRLHAACLQLAYGRMQAFVTCGPENRLKKLCALVVDQATTVT